MAEYPLTNLEPASGYCIPATLHQVILIITRVRTVDAWIALLLLRRERGRGRGTRVVLRSIANK